MTAPTGHIVLYCGAALATAACLALTLGQLTAQAQQWGDRRALHHTSAVLGLAPVYAVCALVALVWPRAQPYCDGVGSVVEACALYELVALLLHYFYQKAPRGKRAESRVVPLTFLELRDDPALHEQQQLELLFEECAPVEYCCGALVLWPSGAMLRWARRLVAQYVLVRLCETVVQIALHESAEQAYDRSPDPRHAYFWMTSLVNLSMTLALGAALLLVELLEPVLWPHDPWLKFGSLKLLIFALYWQSMALSGLAYLGQLPLAYFAPWSVLRLADALQNTLVCVEMALLALCWHWVFRTDEPKRVSALPEVLRDTC
jgi:hypothetical protein